jgi:1-acyl-sn-glycerol-3-phosphate acyltransferase
MVVLRSLIYAVLFYTGTALCVLGGLAASLIGHRQALVVVLGWVKLNHWLAEHVLDIRMVADGEVPRGAYLIAVKHESMLETTEMVRLSKLPVIVIKRELADIPFFGLLTRRYGVIPVDRSAGAKALREMVAAGKAAIAAGRPILIFPEGTRVPVGETPPLRPGFAGLYRALGLPVVPVAVDSGRLWGRGWIHRPGLVTFKIGDTIPPGLPRDEIEARVHTAINALTSAPQARA